jgi:GxxExxY protein
MWVIAGDERDPQTSAILGAAIEVHKILGRGFLEPVYQDALAIEFRLRGIPFLRETAVPIVYKGERISSHYKADFICYDSIIVELKALSVIGNVEQGQVLNYLKATGLKRALLINFGNSKIECKRLVV